MKKAYVSALSRSILALWLLCFSSVLAEAGVTCTLPFNLQNNTVADATQVMANYNALVTCLGNAAAAGTNSDITALLGLLTPIGPVAGGSSVYTAGTSTGSANAQVIASPSPTGFALVRGNSIAFIAGFTNTGATQINVNGQGLTNIFRQTPSGPQAMTGGEIQSGQWVFAFYDGTQFEKCCDGPQFGGYGPLTTLASASTADLGTIPSHNITFTGTTTINSFGSSANATFPFYRLNFTTAITLTYNATSMILPGATNITTASGDEATAMYLGAGNWQIIEYVVGALPVANLQRCGFDQLSMSNGASNSVINWSYNNATLINSRGGAFTPNAAQSGTVTITNGTGGTSTAGGMDGSAPGNNQMVAIWGIYNGTTWSAVGTKNAFPTLPILPSGYFASCYAGSFKTNGSGNLFGEIVSGNEARFVVGGANLATTIPQIDNGGTNKGSLCASGSTTYATETVRGNSGAAIWMPSSAVIGSFVLTSTSAGTTAFSSNSVATATNGGQLGMFNGTTASVVIHAAMESNNVFYCSTGAVAANQLFQYGWKDAVNAN